MADDREAGSVAVAVGLAVLVVPAVEEDSVAAAVAVLVAAVVEEVAAADEAATVAI